MRRARVIDLPQSRPQVRSNNGPIMHQTGSINQIGRSENYRRRLDANLTALSSAGDQPFLARLVQFPSLEIHIRGSGQVGVTKDHLHIPHGQRIVAAHPQRRGMA